MSKVSISGNASGTGTFTIASPNGNTDRTINLPDSNGTILTTATAGVPIGGPAFSAFKFVAQSISDSTWTKVSFTSEEFDTAGAYDATTNSRFQPLVAGYYQINWGVCGQSNTGTARILAAVWKNGNEAYRSTDMSTLFGVTGSALVYLNGSTDYVEIYAYFAATTRSITEGKSLTFFQAFLARSAT